MSSFELGKEPPHFRLCPELDTHQLKFGELDGHYYWLNSTKGEWRQSHKVPTQENMMEITTYQVKKMWVIRNVETKELVEARGTYSFCSKMAAKHAFHEKMKIHFPYGYTADIGNKLFEDNLLEVVMYGTT
jgi:hypothetical protein